MLALWKKWTQRRQRNNTQLLLRIAELEADLEAEVKRLQAMQWVPVREDNTLLLDAEADGDRRMYINEQGTTLELYLEGVYKIFSLPEGYAVCRRVPQPPTKELGAQHRVSKQFLEIV